MWGPREHFVRRQNQLHIVKGKLRIVKVAGMYTYTCVACSGIHCSHGQRNRLSLVSMDKVCGHRRRKACLAIEVDELSGWQSCKEYLFALGQVLRVRYFSLINPIRLSSIHACFSLLSHKNTIS